MAGILAGLAVSGLQSISVTPLILEAETYETAAAHDHGADMGGKVWTPEEGPERVLFTVIANCLVGVGFGLLLTAGLTLAGHTGWRHGLFWGLAGFAAFILAPNLGLAPSLPGMEEADLHARQLWWLLATSATAVGLALIFMARRAALVLLGVGLLALPHVVGAPLSGHGHGGVPAALVAEFGRATLVANMVFWIVLGLAAGSAHQRFRSSP